MVLIFNQLTEMRAQYSGNIIVKKSLVKMAMWITTGQPLLQRPN